MDTATLERFEDLGREALAVAELLRARAKGLGQLEREPRDWWTAPEVTTPDAGRIQ